MSNYQVLARKYRPQSFSEVLGQEAIVTTLKNAIKFHRLAHAYLFCGSRGTGKTTLARVFAKALNCQAPTDGEPCSVCSSCKEIASGHSLDVLEIDGASNRGIDDIRQINETVGYAAASGRYKIYIIDEVHMLTKEAFNALLKTLEEPPAKVLFLFATTEPHKVLPTILSRCQRFNLNRIPIEKIINKLKRIAKELGIDVEAEALHLLAQRADGGLRDAESLFDQIIAFHEGRITVNIVADVLGVMPKDTLFALDQAGKEGRLSMAFEISHQIFSQGKDFVHFVESLTEHFRSLLLIKLSGPDAPFLLLSESDKPRYEASAKLYTQEQCVTILDFLIESQNQIRFQSSGRIAVEAILLRIMRIHQRLPVEFLVRRLAELEQAIQSPSSQPAAASDEPAEQPVEEPVQEPVQEAAEQPVIQTISEAPAAASRQPPATQAPQATAAVAAAVMPAQASPPAKQPASHLGSVSEDPTPTPRDLGIRSKPKETIAPPPAAPLTPPPPMPPAAVPDAVPDAVAAKAPGVHKQHRYDTILQFAAIELEGTVQKKQIR